MTGKANFENTSDLKDDWMIKNCLVYDEEYSDCTSMKARFNQWFIFGKTLDCSQWKRDSVNCYKWVDNKDKNAADRLQIPEYNGKLYYVILKEGFVVLTLIIIELIESEKQRRMQRLLGHYKNDVWTRRKSPPENWNAPLPEYLQKEYEATYLNVKSKEMRGEIPPTFDPNIKFCTIL